MLLLDSILERSARTNARTGSTTAPEDFVSEYQGQTAVITGGASGIGLSLATRLAADGMQLLLADIEERALETAAAGLRTKGATVEIARCDVSDRDAVDALADQAYSTFGAVHFLANNAGVVTRHDSWGALEDWDWVLGIDLMGVVYGVHSFVPRMLEGGQAGHIMNTASAAGLLAFPQIASYNVAKRGVVALSETMYHELEATPLSVSVLCPGIVATRIGDSERNRPGADRLEADPAEPSAASLNRGAETIEPAALADFIVDETRAGTFWLVPHRHYGEQALEQAQRRLDRGKPVMPAIMR